MIQKEKYLLALILSVTASTSCILLYFYDHRSLIYFGDAVSHIVRARQFIDSQQPGWSNIGTVWLPLPHLLLIPFVTFDSLFYSGLAGAILGIPLFVGTGLFLFSIIYLLTNSRPIAFFIALVFCLNPNVVYIALTPMNEISLLFFVTLGGYALLKWIRTQKERWLLLCTLAVICATLCRYEAWFLAPFVSIVALHQGILFSKQKKQSNALRMVFIAGIVWSGIIFWFSWNYLQYDDPLKFARWTYSVGTSEVRNYLSDQPWKLFSIIGKALFWIFGPMMVISGLFMFFSLKRLSGRKEQSYLLLFFAVPAFFVFPAIMFGFVQMDEWWWNWRFLLPFGLFLATASAILLSELFQKVKSPIVRGVVILCFCLTPAVQMTNPAVGVALYNDAAKSYDAQSQSAALLGRELEKKYDSGSVALLTGYGSGQRIMISSNLPLTTFNVIYFPTESLLTVSERYFIIGKEQKSESEEFSNYWISNRQQLLVSHNIIIEDKYFVLLKRK